jgi:tetratricopeptide (TPR) repeat protein
MFKQFFRKPDENDAMFSKGVKLLQLGKYKEAIQLFDRVIETYSEYPGAWFHKGYALRMLGKHEATQCFDRAIAEILVYKGENLLNSRKCDEAFKFFDNALEIEPKLGSAWAGKGRAFEAQGNSEEAINCYNKLEEIDPVSAGDSFYYLSGTLLNLGRNEVTAKCKNQAFYIDPLYKIVWPLKGSAFRYEEALRCCDKALSNGSIFSDLCWPIKGQALNCLGRFKEALKCFDKALEIDPKSAESLSGKGYALEALGMCDEAGLYYKKATETNPISSTFELAQQAVALISSGSFEKAIECFAKALEIYPKYSPLWINKGYAFASLGHHVKAIECYTKALENEPNLLEALFNKGCSLALLSQHEEAIKCWDKVLEIDPENAAAVYKKGNDLHHLNRHEESITCYTKALEIDPKNLKLWCIKGVLLNILGRHEEASDCFDKASGFDLNYPLLWLIISESYKKVGRYKEAEKFSQKALEIDPKCAEGMIDKDAYFLNLLFNDEKSLTMN